VTFWDGFLEGFRLTFRVALPICIVIYFMWAELPWFPWLT